MKKNIQKITLLLVVFIFSTVATFAGEDQCTLVATPTPEFVEIIETTPISSLETTDITEQLPEFIQSESIRSVINALSILF